MKKFNKIKVKGSGIVEVLIALAITTFSIALATIIYLNIQKSSLPFLKIKAVELAKFYMEQTLQKDTFYDENYAAEEFTVKKTVIRHEQFNDCLVIRMVVFNLSRKKICELETSVFNGN
jgi:hypothetical protein